MSSEWLGWLSSFILCLTIAKQLHTQYKQDTSQGVSRWLYLGQFIAEIGFIIYSLLVRNWVFVFTNTVLLFENVAGVLLIRHQRNRKNHSATAREKVAS